MAIDPTEVITLAELMRQHDAAAAGPASAYRAWAEMMLHVLADAGARIDWAAAPVEQPRRSGAIVTTPEPGMPPRPLSVGFDGQPDSGARALDRTGEG